MLEHLERNALLLPEDVARMVLTSTLVEISTPQLIALNAAELSRITNFKWSPYYAGTDIHSAVAADPIPDDGHCDQLLARVIREYANAGMDVIFPHALASSSDPFLAHVSLEWTSFEDRVFFVCRSNPDESIWLQSFDDTLARTSTAGAFDIGFCTPSTPAPCNEWNRNEIERMIASADCVFAAALDGEGYLVWKLEHPITTG